MLLLTSQAQISSGCWRFHGLRKSPDMERAECSITRWKVRDHAEEDREEEETGVLDRLRFWEGNCESPVVSPTVDRDLPLEPLSDSIQQLRSFDEELKEESLFLVECDAIYISEEDAIQTSSDMNLEESSAISEVVHSIKRIKRLNTDLQKSLDMAEDSNSALRAENTVLKSQIKTLKQNSQDDRHLKDELDTIRAAKLEQEQICGALEASKKQLEKKNETLKDQNEAIASEMSIILAEKEMYKKKSEELSQLLTALQQEMMESRIHHEQINEIVQEKDVFIKQLEDTIRDYMAIKQDMNEKIQDLEGQLALAVVSGSGCTFMNIDNTLEADIQCSLSLGEELGLLPGGQMECTSEEEEKDDENDTEQHSLEEEGKKNKENKDEMKIEKVERTEEAETEEEEASLSDCPVSWLMESYQNLRRGAHAAGVVGIGFLVPLGLLRALTPVVCDWVGLTCADFMWITLRQLIEPYCSVYHIGLPPV
ncbi:hypothetical protein MHYP_G00291060 [Metynnis hypsauchen]